MKLSAVQERLHKNAVIMAARQCVYNSVYQEFNISLKVGDISEIITKGTTPKTYGFDFIPEGIPFLRAEDVLDGEVCYEQTNLFIDAETNKFMNRSRTYSGDILITIAGTIGRAAVVPEMAPEMNVNQAVALIRCKDKVNPYYIYHMLQSHGVQQQITKSTVTSAIPNLSLSMIKDLKIPIPPIKDQNMIAMFLEAVHKKQDWNNNTNILPSYVKDIPRIISNIQQLTNKIEEARKVRREAVEDINRLISSSQARIFENVPKQNVRKLSDLAILERGKFSHRPRNNPYFFGGEHPWIQIAEIGQAGKYIRQWTQTLNDEGLNISKKFPKGTLLISIAATIGAVGILDFDCCIPDSIVAVIPKPGTDSEYLYHYFGYVRNHLESLAPQSAQKNINLEILSALPIPLLSLSQQRDIVLYFDNLQNRINTTKYYQTETTAELDALLPSILDKAFKGEL